MHEIFDSLQQFWSFTGFYNCTWQHLVMVAIGLIFIFLGIVKKWEPLLLVPIGFGIIVGNIPLPSGMQVGIYEEGSVLNILYQGVVKGWYPPLIFLGIGAMTDFSSLISQPRLILIGAAAQMGIFGAFLLALWLGFTPQEAGAIGIIGGADGPTAIFLSSKLAPHLLGAIAVSAYSYYGTCAGDSGADYAFINHKEGKTHQNGASKSGQPERENNVPDCRIHTHGIHRPVWSSAFGYALFGNLLKESGVTRRLAETARGPLIDVVTTLIGLTVGASTQADQFLSPQSIKIFILGLISFVIATFCGVLFVKIMNLFCKEGRKINPLIGNAGVSAVPDSARVSEVVGRKFDKDNHLLMHAMAPNVAGVIGSAVAAGILLGFLG